MKNPKMLLVFVVLFMTGYSAQAALQHFSVTQGDPSNSMVITLDGTTDPSLDGVTLATGDEVAVFNKDGVCVGAVVWENTATYITAWGEDGSTPGYEANEAIKYRIWNQSADKEYDNISATHEDSQGSSITAVFDNTEPYIYIASFDAETNPSAPVLSSPEDGEVDVLLAGIMQWNDVLNADSYSLMVSTQSDFSSDVVINETNITSSQYNFSLSQYNTTFYWKVKATDDADGDSDWSSIWSFDTYSGEVKEVEITLALDGMTDNGNHQPVPVSVELRSGSDLMSSTVVKRKAGVVDTNGTVTINFGQVSDGDYYVIARAAGYLPLAAPSKYTLDNTGFSHDFTTGSAQAVDGSKAMIEVNSVWSARGGDFDYSRNVGGFDAPPFINSLGKNVSSSVPAP